MRWIAGTLALAVVIGLGIYLNHGGFGPQTRVDAGSSVKKAESAESPDHAGAKSANERGGPDLAARIRSMLKLQDGEIGMVSAPEGTLCRRKAGVEESGAQVAMVLSADQTATTLEKTLLNAGTACGGFQVSASGEQLACKEGEIGLKASTSPDSEGVVQLRVTTDEDGKTRETMLQVEKGSAVVMHCGNSDLVLVTGK